MRRYEIRDDVPTRETFEKGVRIGLGYADKPRQYQVGLDVASNRALIIVEIEYPADRYEETKALVQGRARIAYGCHSKRLFNVRLDCGELFNKSTSIDKDTIGQAVHDLRVGLEKLMNLNSTLGPQLNYKAVTAGLGLGADKLPPWITDALSGD